MNTIQQMPKDSRLWVYQSNRKLRDADINIIQQAGKIFISDWAAHGAALKASFEILYDRFIVISVDEKQALASGCSIDKSVNFIKDLEKQLNINFFDRMQVVYRDTTNDLVSCSFQEFEKLASENKVDSSTIVFNNMVTTKQEFDTQWEVPLKQSWQSRVLK